MCCFSDDSEYMKKNIDKIHDTRKNIDIELKQVTINYPTPMMYQISKKAILNLVESDIRVIFAGNKAKYRTKNIIIFNDNENDHPTAVRGGGML